MCRIRIDENKSGWSMYSFHEYNRRSIICEERDDDTGVARPEGEDGQVFNGEGEGQRKQSRRSDGEYRVMDVGDELSETKLLLARF